MSDKVESATADDGVRPREPIERSEETSRGKTISRRSLCWGVGGIAVLMGLGCLKAIPREPLVRPPGGQNEANLIGSCIRCERCAEVCPRDVIKLTHIEDGVLAMRTPQMDFYRNYCDFCADENGGAPLCAAACPTGAIASPAPSASQKIIGKAKLVKDWCLAYHDTGCHVCYDACPYQAIGLDDHARPYVVGDACNGCGACEAACVSLTDGSRSIAADATTRAITISAQWD